MGRKHGDGERESTCAMFLGGSEYGGIDHQGGPC